VGASPLPPPRTPLPRTQICKTAMRSTLPSSRRRGHYCTMHGTKRTPAPMGPLHLAATTKTLHTFSAAAHEPTKPPPTLPQDELSLRKRRLQGGHDAEAPPSFLQPGQCFNPRPHASGLPYSGAPTGRTTPKSAATTTTRLSAGEGFRLGKHCLRHSLKQATASKLPTTSASPLLERWHDASLQ
jgi:hypothetical protein